jgi:hypothetical protein
MSILQYRIYRSMESNNQMTLEQLRIFVEVAERQHLTQAAAVLALTPSAVSASIKCWKNAMVLPYSIASAAASRSAKRAVFS